MSEMHAQSLGPTTAIGSRSGIQLSFSEPIRGLAPALGRHHHRGLVESLLALVCQRIAWSPGLIGGELWRLLTNIGAYREIRSLLRSHPFTEITEENPGLGLRFTVPNYMARSFSGEERAACFLHHYRRIKTALPEDVLRQIFKESVTVYQVIEGGVRFAWALGTPHWPNDREGELNLSLRVNEDPVFHLSFNIIPGWIVKSDAEEVVLITRLQGARGARSLLRIIHSCLHDYSPRALLLAALQGVADAFGIREIDAVCAADQRSYNDNRAAALKRGYDDFFKAQGMLLGPAGQYFCKTPIEPRPAASFRGRDRSRARKRLAFRRNIQSNCAEFFQHLIDRVNDRVIDRSLIETESAGAASIAPGSAREKRFRPFPPSDLHTFI